MTRRRLPMPDEVASSIAAFFVVEEPMNSREVARLLGIHLNTLKRIPPEDLPFFRVVRRGDRRYLPQDVKRYIALRMHR